MKLTFLFLLTGLIAVSASTYSQNTRLDIKVKDNSLIDLFREIEDKSEFYFFYQKEELVDLENISVTKKNAKVTEILDEALEGTTLEYKIVDRYIIIRKDGKGLEDVESITSQQNSISGTVSDEDGLPLPGVTILIKGTTNGTVTNMDGNYSISNVPAGATLQFSFVGMLTQEVTVGSQTNINVTMAVDAIGLEEVVAIGYGTQKKAAITGAIATMNSEVVENIPVPNLSNALAGRISGVYVKQASGAPGYAAEIQVRAVNTWKNSGKSPLYVIDGVITNKASFDALDYSEVEDLTVLKDAASGAIYGARAANGVILVTTKTGTKGKFRLDYNYSYSFDKPSKIPEYVGAYDMVMLSMHAAEVAGQPPFADEQEIAYFKENDPALDWYNLAYTDPTLQKHSLTASGGGDKVRYFVGGSYFDQKAFIKTAGFTKFTFRSNVDVDFTDELSGTFKMSFNEGITERFSYQEDVKGFDANPQFGPLWGRLLYYLPYARPTTTDGKFINPGWIGSPIAFIEEGGTNTASDQNADMLAGLTYKIPGVDGLSVSGKFSRNYSYSSVKEYTKKPTVYNVRREGTHNFIYTDEVISSTKTSWPSKEKLGKRQRTNKSYQLNIGANYEKSFGKHNVDAMFVYEQSEGTNDMFYGVRENFPLLYKDQFWATGSSRDDSYVNGSEYEYGRASYIGRLGYQYDDKYFVKATIRRDGSMLFAPDYRWGNFPSISAGWVLSNEDFIDVGFIDFLKLRASWGLAGNDAVGGWKWTESYRANGSVNIGESTQPRVRYNGIVNEELTWEKTKEVNIGIDSRIFNNIIFNVEYYKRHNYDILDSRIVSLPSSFGGSMPPVNYGIVDSHGLEFEIGYTGNVGDFQYGVQGNFTYATNKVIERDVAENVRDADNPNGRSTDYVKMLVATDIIRTQADLDALPDGYRIFGKLPALGALNFEDVSGLEPGVPDGKIDNYDRQVLEGKHYNPPYTFGLNLTGEWKGLGVDVFFQGAAGISKLYNDGYGRRFHHGARPPVFWMDSWTPENINAEYPQVVPWGFTNDHQASTFWLKNGNYLRLQHLNLHYSLPKAFVQKLRLANVKLNLTGTNLLTFSSFDYYDVTVSETRSYPTMKTYTLGVNVTF